MASDQVENNKRNLNDIKNILSENFNDIPHCISDKERAYSVDLLEGFLEIL